MVVAGGAVALVRVLFAFSGDAAVLEHACGAVWNIAGCGNAVCRPAFDDSMAVAPLAVTPSHQAGIGADSGTRPAHAASKTAAARAGVAGGS